VVARVSWPTAVSHARRLPRRIRVCLGLRPGSDAGGLGGRAWASAYGRISREPNPKAQGGDAGGGAVGRGGAHMGY
jgi:hypothetical protein